jgi:hypothetical protein
VTLLVGAPDETKGRASQGRHQWIDYQKSEQSRGCGARKGFGALVMFLVATRPVGTETGSEASGSLPKLESPGALFPDLQTRPTVRRSSEQRAVTDKGPIRMGVDFASGLLRLHH